MRDEYDFSQGVRGKYIGKFSPLVCGIDEAGRGPVIGPMVMAGVIMEEEKNQDLIELGVKDSKLLSASERQRLYKYIVKMAINHIIISFDPAEIDAALNDPIMNLNHLEAKATASVIDVITPTPSRVITDCPSTNMAAYIQKVKSFLGKPTKAIIISEHKADVNYPIVSAASILAKVTRDEAIERLKKYYKVDFGSGYPSDPKTKKFLAENYAKPKYSSIFRKSWKTYKELTE